MTNRKIFVGSSHEAERLANEVVGQLITRAGMELVPWRTVLRTGEYLLEAFEKNVVQQVSGAILLATPDVFGTRADLSFSSPVANVILEYGYLAARLGRERVAICEFDDVSLPTDLAGLKNVKAGKYARSQPSLPENTETELLGWFRTLPPLANEIPPLRQLHGYSGKWMVHSDFTLWAGKPVKRNEVVFNGFAVLCLEATGTRGFGMQQGILSVDLAGYQDSFDVCNEVVHALIHEVDGEVTLTLEVRVLYRERRGAPEGTPPHARRDWLKQPERAPAFYIHLKPDPNKPKALTGFHEFAPAGLYQKADEWWTYEV